MRGLLPGGEIVWKPTRIVQPSSHRAARAGASRTLRGLARILPEKRDYPLKIN